MQGGSDNPDDAADQIAGPNSSGNDDTETSTEPPAGDAAPVEPVDEQPSPDDFWEATVPAGLAQPAPAVAAPGASSAAPSTPPPPTGPSLPGHTAAPPPPMAVMTQQPQRGAETWYRTDQDRYKSVHRRANPWYRRLARGLIGMSFIAAAAIGLYFGGKAIQNYLDREKLPDQGVEIPDVRSTTIQFSSSAPAPQVEGTLTLDTATRAFEFVGTGAQAGTEIVSPDGATVYVRRGAGNWRLITPADTDAAAVRTAIGYVADNDGADDILTSHLRRGYVDLDEYVEVGEGDDQLRKYELTLDTRGFDLNFPLQYRQFRDDALPAVDEVRAHAVNIWLDDESVLVRVEDLRTMWSWERLAYSDQPFTPTDPADSLLDQTIEITDGTLSGDADTETTEPTDG